MHGKRKDRQVGRKAVQRTDRASNLLLIKEWKVGEKCKADRRNVRKESECRV